MTRTITPKLLGLCLVLVLASGAWAEAPVVLNREELLQPCGFEAHGKDNINSMLYYVGIGE